MSKVIKVVYFAAKTFIFYVVYLWGLRQHYVIKVLEDVFNQYDRNGGKFPILAKNCRLFILNNFINYFPILITIRTLSPPHEMASHTHTHTLVPLNRPDRPDINWPDLINQTGLEQTNLTWPDIPDLGWPTWPKLAELIWTDTTWPDMTRTDQTDLNRPNLTWADLPVLRWLDLT